MLYFSLVKKIKLGNGYIELLSIVILINLFFVFYTFFIFIYIFYIGVIVLSSIKLALDTYLSDNDDTEKLFDSIDKIFTIIFIIEAMLKILAFGLQFSYNFFPFTKTKDFFLIQGLIYVKVGRN